MNLSILGISAEAERLYRYFLRHPGKGVDAARQDLGLDPDTTEAEAETLGGLALLDLTDRHRVIPADPATAIERLIEQRVDRLNADVRRVLAARAAIPRLARDRGDTPDVERVEGTAGLRQRLDDLAFFAHSERLFLFPGGPLTQCAVDAACTLDARCLRRGLALKSICHPAALDDPRIARHLHDIVGRGAQVRVAAAPLDLMIVFDRSVAVLPADGFRGALFVREPVLVSQLARYFDTVWRAAGELGALGEPSRLERRVLAALATTGKDEIAARELDMSVRTFRRQVAAIMARLGAVNRFQAGLRAKEEGWM